MSVKFVNSICWALPFGFIITILYVLGTDRLIYRFYRKNKSANIILMMASVGVKFVVGVVFIVVLLLVGYRD